MQAECICCGDCCYFKGIPCKYLSNTQRCQVYNVRLGLDCGNGGHCVLRSWVDVPSCPMLKKD